MLEAMGAIGAFPVLLIVTCFAIFIIALLARFVKWACVVIAVFGLCFYLMAASPKTQERWDAKSMNILKSITTGNSKQIQSTVKKELMEKK